MSHKSRRRNKWKRILNRQNGILVFVCVMMSFFVVMLLSKISEEQDAKENDQIWDLIEKKDLQDVLSK